MLDQNIYMLKVIIFVCKTEMSKLTNTYYLLVLLHRLQTISVWTLNFDHFDRSHSVILVRDKCIGHTFFFFFLN